MGGTAHDDAQRPPLHRPPGPLTRDDTGQTWPRWFGDTLAIATYLALALIVTAGLWSSGGTAATADNTRDHAQFLFFFEHAASSVTHLHNPLFTPLMGAPYGVNLMANTAFLGMAVPLIPVTLWAGAGISYALALTIALAGTATAWYYVLQRHITAHRGVAFAAAALCGFAPGMVGHGNGHPNIAAQFLLPLIGSAIIRLGTAARPVRSGLVLGLLVAYQVFLNEELLLLLAMASVVALIVFAVSRPEQTRAIARPLFIGLGVAVAVAGVLTAYPLWFQFFGPQHYRGPVTWAPSYFTDLADYPSYPQNAVVGRLSSGSTLNDDPGETNAFLGLPLLVFASVAGVALWRVVAARIATVVAVVFGVLSLGTTITIRHRQTPVPGPWRLVADLPLFDSVITPRLALVVVPAVAVLLALAADRMLATTPEPGRRALVWAAVAAVLAPLVPTPLHTTAPQAVPMFFSAGTWRRYVDDGTIVPVPPDSSSEPTLRALVAADLTPRFVDGYFLGPVGPTVPTARYGPPDRPTGLLLEQVASSGQAPEVNDAMRAIARRDLAYWGADVIVLVPRDNAAVLLQTVDELVGRLGQFVDGVWVWDVRDL